MNVYLEDVASVCGFSHDKFRQLYAGIRKQLTILVYHYQNDPKIRKIMIDNYLIENCLSKDL